jgi:hypothetical protein
MRKLWKVLFYSLITTILLIFTVYCIKEHPELELYFLIPGLFILVMSGLHDNFYVANRLRATRER